MTIPAKYANRVYLSTGEVGEFLPWCGRTVVRRIEDGTLRGKKLGGTWLVDAASVWEVCGMRAPVNLDPRLDRIAHQVASWRPPHNQEG